MRPTSRPNLVAAAAGCLPARRCRRSHRSRRQGLERSTPSESLTVVDGRPWSAARTDPWSVEVQARPQEPPAEVRIELRAGRWTPGRARLRLRLPTAERVCQSPVTAAGHLLRRYVP